MRDTVLVTGATGTVGREVVEALREAGRPVRAAARDVEAARTLLGGDTEIVRFDFEDPSTFGDAFRGVGAVFLMRPPDVSAVARVMGPAIDHAVREGAPHLVVLSVMGAGVNPILPHHALERLVRRSGTAYTLLRPSFFMQNLSGTYRDDIAERGEIFVPAGRGRTSFIDVRDIAAAAAAVLGEERHFGRAYTLTGGEALRYDEVAEIFTRVLGRPVRYARPSARAFRRRLREQGVEEPFIRVLRGIYLTARLGLAASVTPDTRRLLRRPPLTMEEFVRDHRTLWEPEGG